MQDKIKEKSPAKINLFLKIINKREDGFHNIRTGMTLINLYDEITVEPYKEFKVKYTGTFLPSSKKFDDCIIEKLFKYLNLNPPNILFSIKKNFPYEAGLGSASSNAATVIKILENLKIIEHKNKFHYVNLGSDIPFFLNSHDCLVRGKGDLIKNTIFPKYYFLLIKPNFGCSTESMYNSFKKNDFNFPIENDLEEINEFDNGNDFEIILKKKEQDFLIIFNFMDNLDNVIYSRLSGSGSCIYSVFENKHDADVARIKFKKNYPNLWSEVVENNNLY